MTNQTAHQASHVNGTMPAAANEMTALQRHVAFFDRDGDGRVTIGEVVDTLRLLGCSNAYAYINGIGGMLARTTAPGLASHEVVVSNAHRGKYRDARLSGETRIFDEQGRFDTDRFDEVVACYGRPSVDGLSESDVAAMIEHISLPGTVGRSSAQLAFRLLMTIAGEPDPRGELVITRARLRAFYEGELLPALLTQSTGVTNVEPIQVTVKGVAVGAIQAVCPFKVAVASNS